MSAWPTMEDSEVVVENDTSRMDMDQKEERNNDNSHLTWLMGTVYQLIMIMLGIVIITASIFNSQSQLISFSVEVCAIYLTTVTLVFLLYVHCYLLRQKNSEVRVPDKILSPAGNSGGKSSNIHEHQNSTTAVDRPKLRQGATVPAIMYCDGVDIYLRLGALAFCVGVVILHCFSVVVYAINWSYTVWNILHVSGIIQRIVLYFFQTYFIFTCHGIVINKHKAFVRFGLKHMIACNLCFWCYLLMREASETLTHHDSTNTTKTNVPAIIANVTGPGVSPGLKNEAHAGVKIEKTLEQVSPYLYPLAIEYCLISTVMLYKIHHNVGKFQAKMFETIAKSSPHRASSSNGSLGLFLGIFVVVVTLISQSAFLMLTESLKFSRIQLFISYTTELFILLIAFIGSIVGFLQLHQLRFSNNEDASVDSAFLLVAFFIGGLYNVFLLVSSVGNIAGFGWIAVLGFTVAVLYLIQMVSQSVFIMDGLCRCVGTDSQAHTKPGRGAVMMLLLCNLSLWLVHTTEVKIIKSYPMHSNFYGYLPWNFIHHACMPMAIFYRFHSTVCLSSISELAYKKYKLS